MVKSLALELSIFGILEFWAKIGELGSLEGNEVGLSSWVLVKRLTLGLSIFGILEFWARIGEVGSLEGNGVGLSSWGLVESLTLGLSIFGLAIDDMFLLFKVSGGNAVVQAMFSGRFCLFLLLTFSHPSSSVFLSLYFE